ncbi:hypothetical protein MKS61_02170, partial [Staphylococcus haemolyticus]|nr:hypothetical protein [Staphylococcus haemolyticus]
IDMDSIRLLKSIELMVCFLVKYSRYIFNQAVTTSLLQEIGSTKYPESYRYGFYSTPQVNRINGVFFGQIFTVYFNEDYIIVLATNKVDYSKVSNESIISHIYYQLLGQNIYETK